MQFDFTYQLSSKEEKERQAFFQTLKLAAIEQSPYWPLIEDARVRYCYFSAQKNNQLFCTAVIRENLSRTFPTANIQFGPLFDDADHLIASIKAIYQYYHKKGFIACTIQLAIITGPEVDYIEYKLNKELQLRTFFNKDNWSSLLLDLNQPEDQILKNFSKGHKSDIKKALKSNIQVVDSSADDFSEFCMVFEKMNQKRGLNKEPGEFSSFLKRVEQFFRDQQAGAVLIVKDEAGTVMGGIMLAFQGNTIRFYKGASDPDYRHLPILHLAIWEGIKKAKKLGFEYFDFWGYNHFVDERDQIFYINKFKKGFGGKYAFYPKKVYFIFKPVKYRLFLSLKEIRNRFSGKSN